MNIFITGIAGMIGFHSALKLTEEGHTVVGLDNFNDYYDVNLKKSREQILLSNGIEVIFGDIKTFDFDKTLENVDVVLHLAAYANPRHSLEYPQFYIDTNIAGTQAVIKACERNNIENVVYASSSCVMHGQPLPWNELDKPDHQNNPYGWSKYVNECQFKYSTIKNTIGLRFFTVYGPYGRPDMALFLFTDAILSGRPLTLYNNGDMKRDFTYVGDIVQGISLALAKCVATQATNFHDIYNIGYGESVNLMDFVKEIEKNTGKQGIYNFSPKHPADVPATWSDTSKLQELGYSPSTSIASGITKFIDWYVDYYKVKL